MRDLTILFVVDHRDVAVDEIMVSPLRGPILMVFRQLLQCSLNRERSLLRC